MRLADPNERDSERLSDEAGCAAAQGPVLRRGEALAPSVVRSSDPAGIVGGGIATGVAALGLVALALSNLPGGFVLFALVAPLAAWSWLCGRAWRANADQRALRGKGVVVLGRVVDVGAMPGGGLREARETDGQTVGPDGRWDPAPRYAVRFEYWLEDAAFEAVAEGLDAWSVRRYERGQQVGVLLDPEVPAEGQLFPAPGGGGAIDLMSDVVAWLLRARPDRETGPGQDPKSKAEPPTRGSGPAR